MIMMTLHFRKEVPFDTVYVHGLVRDGGGAENVQVERQRAGPD